MENYSKTKSGAFYKGFFKPSVIRHAGDRLKTSFT